METSLDKPAAICGTFSDIKTIRTRGQVQLIIEVAIEQADAALAALGGIPQPGKEVSVAIALLASGDGPADAPLLHPPLKAGPGNTEGAAPDPAKSERAKAAYRDKAPMQQAATRAALLCRDERFQRWARQHTGAAMDEAGAAEWMRDGLDIKSRSDIATDPAAYERFLQLETSFKQAMGLLAEAR